MSHISLEGVEQIALEAAPNGVVVFDEAGVILLVNRRTEMIFGFPREELIGAGIDLLLPERSRPARASAGDRAGHEPLLTGGRRKDGSEVPVEVTLTTTIADGARLWIASVVNIPERRRLERDRAADLGRRLAFEGHAVQVAARFVNVPADKMDDAITESLREIVLALDLDRGGLWQFAESDGSLRYTHAWTRPEFRALPPDVNATEMFPWLVSKVRANEAVWTARVGDVPAALDRENMKKMGSRASAVIPLTHNDRVVGALSFGSLRHEVAWSPEIRERMLLLAAVFAQALARKHNREQLNRALADVERLRVQLARENVQLRDEVRNLRGPSYLAAESASVRTVLAQVDSVAQTGATVLLLGETGSGKEVFAEAIHAASERRDRPMVRVNCAAIPTPLMESELFGRERGAYTGALSRQIGRFELADGTTIFLDEVGELALEAQAKLLRVIQDKVLERLGSTRPIQVDVRIIAATNCDLKKAVAHGSFREDLYYRLNVFPIVVPSLRERLEDIPVLVWTFVDEFARTFNKKIESISRSDLAALQQYAWPGNVRELRNVIERAVIVAKGPRLSVAPPHADAIPPRASAVLADVESSHIRSILERAGWRVRGRGGAAELLGMKPTTLDSRMVKLGIKRPGR